jgi:hypothetical protein
VNFIVDPVKAYLLCLKKSFSDDGEKREVIKNVSLSIGEREQLGI